MGSKIESGQSKVNGDAPIGDSSGGCPFQAGEPGGLTYNSYLKIPELLQLQELQSDPPHHDELLFILIHQSYELWFKLVLSELSQCREEMLNGKPLEANHFLVRANQVMKHLVNQIHLLETMRPIDFLQFRDRLRPASGFQSVQFREIEFTIGLRDERFLEHFKSDTDAYARLVARSKDLPLQAAFFKMLRDKNFKVPEGEPPAILDADPASKNRWVHAILPIYQMPEKYHAEYLLSESLIDFDQAMDLWREHHIRVVERIIGVRMGTGGSNGVEYLRSMTGRRAFPYLWESRNYLLKLMEEKNETQ